MGIDTGPAERLADQRVDGKRRKVAFVEHNRVAERNRPLVVDRVVQQGEHLTHARTQTAEAIEQRGPIKRRGSGGRHRNVTNRIRSRAYLDLHYFSAVRLERVRTLRRDYIAPRQ